MPNVVLDPSFPIQVDPEKQQDPLGECPDTERKEWFIPDGTLHVPTPLVIDSTRLPTPYKPTFPIYLW